MSVRLLNQGTLLLAGIYLLFQLGSPSQHHQSGCCHLVQGDFKFFADSNDTLAECEFRNVDFSPFSLFVTTIERLSVPPSIATYVAPLRSRAPPV